MPLRMVTGVEQGATLVLTSGLHATTVNMWHPSGSVVAPGKLLLSRSGGSGKPMPAAGETAHVRRLIVD